MENFSLLPTMASRSACSAAIRASSIRAALAPAEPAQRLQPVSSARPQWACGAREQKHRRIESGRRQFWADGRYYVGLRSERTIMAFASKLDRAGGYILPPLSFRFPAALHLGIMAGSFSPPASDLAEKSITPFWRSIPVTGCCRHGRRETPNSARLTLRSRQTAISCVSSEHPFAAAKCGDDHSRI
jgi:hypothetical protein